MKLLLADFDSVGCNVEARSCWGNGEVEIGVSSLAEVPYTLGLIRQSLDRQLADLSSTS